MTGVELERIARTVVQPAGSALVAMVDHQPNPTKPGLGTTRYGLAWRRLDGSQSRPIALFDRQADAFRLIDILTGTSSPGRGLRSAATRRAGGPSAGEPDADPDPLGPAAEHHVDTHVGPGSKPSGVPASQGADALAGGSSDGGSPETERAIASASPGQSERLCAGCGEPLPAGARPNRLTHDDACRQRAAYRRAANSGRAARMGATRNLTVSDRSTAPRPGGQAEPATTHAAPGREPDLGLLTEASGGTAVASRSSRPADRERPFHRREEDRPAQPLGSA